MNSQYDVVGFAVVLMGIFLIGTLHLIEILVDHYKVKEKEKRKPKILD